MQTKWLASQIRSIGFICGLAAGLKVLLGTVPATAQQKSVEVFDLKTATMTEFAIAAMKLGAKPEEIFAQRAHGDQFKNRRDYESQMQRIKAAAAASHKEHDLYLWHLPKFPVQLTQFDFATNTQRICIPQHVVISGETTTEPAATGSGQIVTKGSSGQVTFLMAKEIGGTSSCFAKHQDNRTFNSRNVAMKGAYLTMKFDTIMQAEAFNLHAQSQGLFITAYCTYPRLKEVFGRQHIGCYLTNVTVFTGDNEIYATYFYDPGQEEWMIWIKP